MSGTFCDHLPFFVGIRRIVAVGLLIWTFLCGRNKFALIKHAIWLNVSLDFLRILGCWIIFAQIVGGSKYQYSMQSQVPSESSSEYVSTNIFCCTKVQFAIGNVFNPKSYRTKCIYGERFFCLLKSFPF